MNNNSILFWNVDTQEDFIDAGGNLYVQGAETIRPVLMQLTGMAKSLGIRVINTCDYHFINAEEISDDPDYITKFPPHCMAGTSGAHFIRETDPEMPVIIDWDSDLAIHPEFDDKERFRNIVLRKNDFDVFSGNPYTEMIVKIINPEKIFVYGVTTNICVDLVITGLRERGLDVYVLEDAIKELPNLPLPYEKWRAKGVKMIRFADLENYL